MKSGLLLDQTINCRKIGLLVNTVVWKQPYYHLGNLYKHLEKKKSFRGFFMQNVSITYVEDSDAGEERVKFGKGNDENKKHK